MMDHKMFCFQCQETALEKGCNYAGICGKSPETANMQDLLIYVTKGLSVLTTRLRKSNKPVSNIVNHLINDNLFMTITNVNFDIERFKERIEKTLLIKQGLLSRSTDKENLHDAALWNGSDFEFKTKAEAVGILSTENEDIRSLKEMITYGLKGIAAYSEHASALNFEDDDINAFVQSTLARTLDVAITEAQLYDLLLETGKYGIKAMALLDEANTVTYGDPEATVVYTGVRKKPGILISGHDLKDIEMLLIQTQGSGVDVYTHSEMLPAHYYPKFKVYPHFAGNYGGAWWNQKEDFRAFNGPIIITTNCLVPPSKSYIKRLWTTGPVGYPDCKHIKGSFAGGKDFSPVIAQAKRCSPPDDPQGEYILGGFGHNQMFDVIEEIIGAVKIGKIRKIVVMAGCDGRQNQRSYYTEFAQKLPDDVIILTAGCGKYRFNHLKLGLINGIPRIIDAGQCNDSYSLILLAQKLKEALGADDINDLPIVYNISWYEQKAVTVLLSLLYLGIRNIYLGPTFPAFISPKVLQTLVEKYEISCISTAEEDIKRSI